jgi:hypothetical protein
LHQQLNQRFNKAKPYSPECLEGEFCELRQ